MAIQRDWNHGWRSFYDSSGVRSVITRKYFEFAANGVEVLVWQISSMFAGWNWKTALLDDQWGFSSLLVIKKMFNFIHSGKRLRDRTKFPISIRKFQFLLVSISVRKFQCLLVSILIRKFRSLLVPISIERTRISFGARCSIKMDIWTQQVLDNSEMFWSS